MLIFLFIVSYASLHLKPSSYRLQYILKSIRIGLVVGECVNWVIYLIHLWYLFMWYFMYFTYFTYHLFLMSPLVFAQILESTMARAEQLLLVLPAFCWEDTRVPLLTHNLATATSDLAWTSGFKMKSVVANVYQIHQK